MSYLADRLDTVGVQVKANRLHLLLGQLKEQGTPLRGVLDQVILLQFLLLLGRMITSKYLNAVIQFHATIDEAVLMSALYAVSKSSNIDKFEIN